MLRLHLSAKRRGAEGDGEGPLPNRPRHLAAQRSRNICYEVPTPDLNMKRDRTIQTLCPYPPKLSQVSQRFCFTFDGLRMCSRKVRPVPMSSSGPRIQRIICQPSSAAERSLAPNFGPYSIAFAQLHKAVNAHPPCRTCGNVIILHFRWGPSHAMSVTSAILRNTIPLQSSRGEGVTP